MKNLTKNQKIFIIIFITIIIILLSYTFFNMFYTTNTDDMLNEDLMINTTENFTNENTAIEAKSEKIIIYIIGSIKNPGIVELETDSRVSDAVNAAGGLLDDADTSKINLAYKLEDGQKVTIPSINDKIDDDTDYEDYISNDSGNMISDASQSKAYQESNIKINLNTATQTELETLPGIGPSIAAKIIAYRSENGKFNTIEDIKNVSGIGTSKFNDIKDNIYV